MGEPKSRAAAACDGICGQKKTGTKITQSAYAIGRPSILINHDDMAMSNPPSQPTRDLLAKAHPPDAVDRIFSEKIEHRTLHLKPSSPPPQTINARAARRKKRQLAKEKKKQKPAPLSARERRRLGLHDIPRQGQSYAIYEPLNKLWMGYIQEVLGGDVFVGGAGAAAKLSSAEFHGAKVEVVRSHCPGRVGIAGIVVRDRKYIMEIITKKNTIKMVPKEGTTFRIQVEIPAEDGEGPAKTFVFDVLGNQLMLRSADRSNRKFKAHFLHDL